MNFHYYLHLITLNLFSNLDLPLDVQTQILKCLIGISIWVIYKHLKINMLKTERIPFL